MLETSEFFKVGATAPTIADIRIISAAHRNLPVEVAEGRFREDLYYRLNVFAIQIPPLRERRNDIFLLAEYFVKYLSDKMNKTILGMSKDFLEALERQTWKGNIRELRNAIERAVILAEVTELGMECLPMDLRSSGGSKPEIPVFDLATMEKLHIRRVLDIRGVIRSRRPCC